MNSGTFIGLALNAIISVVCSWIVGSYYFRRVSRAEKIADQIRYGLQQALLPIIYPKFYDPYKSDVVRPSQSPPKNTDVPYIDVVRFSMKTISPGENLDILIKILDSGLDLDNPAGISVHDYRGRPVGVIAIGLGHCICSINVDMDVEPGIHNITVELVDRGAHNSKPHRNVQTIPFVIQSGAKS